jgi:hypothetical protein
MDTKLYKGNSGVRVKHHTLLFIIILGSLQGHHLLVASLTAYGHKNKCRIYKKKKKGGLPR